MGEFGIVLMLVGTVGALGIIIWFIFHAVGTIIGILSLFIIIFLLGMHLIEMSSKDEGDEE